MSNNVEINDVSDTAFWVAVYRADESQRPDALFHDAFALQLAGERGRKIAESMAHTHYAKWSVVLRTRIIDTFLQNLVVNGVDCVINLGAGLDSRPYRLNLPPSLLWIEADYPHMIQFKNEKLANTQPTCILERASVDLADNKSRRDFLAQANTRGKKIAILTEGVTPYLTNDQVADLAKDLKAQPHFKYWIVDYFSADVLKYMRSKKRVRQMKNAPFKFEPGDWFGFFSRLGWKASEVRYIYDEAVAVQRPPPTPFWMKILALFMSASKRKQFTQGTAYVILEPQS